MNLIVPAPSPQNNYPHSVFKFYLLPQLSVVTVDKVVMLHTKSVWHMLLLCNGTDDIEARKGLVFIHNTLSVLDRRKNGSQFCPSFSRAYFPRGCRSAATPLHSVARSIQPDRHKTKNNQSTLVCVINFNNRDFTVSRLEGSSIVRGIVMISGRVPCLSNSNQPCGSFCLPLCVV